MKILHGDDRPVRVVKYLQEQKVLSEKYGLDVASDSRITIVDYKYSGNGYVFCPWDDLAYQTLGGK